MTKQTFDVIIVGGGSAGAVLAARLSGDAQRRVLLLDAGPDFAPDRYPPVLTDANVVAGSPDFDWHSTTEDAARLGHDVPVPRGRVIGGSSAVNAAVAMRARPQISHVGPSAESRDGRGRRCLPRTRQWKTPRPAMMPGTAAAVRFRSVSGRLKRTRRRCVLSSRPRKLSAWRMFRISTVRLSTVLARIRSTSSTVCGSIRGSLI